MRLRFPAFWALFLAGGAVMPLGATGCGSSNCTETATCQGGGVTGNTDASTEANPEGGGDDMSLTPDVAGDTAEDQPSNEGGPSPDATLDATQDARLDGPADTGGPPPGDSGQCNTSAPDCSNPQCQASFACTAAAPSGWFGPVALYDQGGGPPAPNPAPCSGAYSNDAFDGHSTPNSPALACGCSCGAPTGICTNATIVIYSDNQCGAANNCGTAGAPVCTLADGSKCNTGGGSVMVTGVPQVTGSGSCTAGTTVTSTPSWAWTRTGRGCGTNRALATGGCGTNQVCADKSSSNFQSKLCVWQNANLADCSAATGYPLLHKYYTNATDGRTCGAGTCQCSTPTGTTCTLMGAQWFNSPPSANCASGGQTLDVTTGRCNGNLGGSSVVSIKASIASSGMCPTTGSASPGGSVSPDTTTAITVCCAQ
jgi:hypothetical protein